MHPAAAATLALAREALLDAWALVQPVDCLGCGAPDRALCSDCRASMRPGSIRRIRCDSPLAVPVWAGADYSGPVRGAILALKEHGRVDAAKALAPILRAAVRFAAEQVGAGLDSVDVTRPDTREARSARPPGRSGEGAAAARTGTAVPTAPTDEGTAAGGRGAGPPELARIPTTRRALVRRGLDPLAELLRVARLPGSDVLRPVRQWRGGAQKARDRTGRLAGDRGRFRARTSLAGRTFLLVDDVATTGATLAAAVRAIEEGGGYVVGCVALAAPDLLRRVV